MRYKTHIITQKFWLTDEERRKVVYCSAKRYDYEGMWVELAKMGAKKPENALCIKSILWDPEDGGCLVDWVIGISSPVNAIP